MKIVIGLFIVLFLIAFIHTKHVKKKTEYEKHRIDGFYGLVYVVTIVAFIGYGIYTGITSQSNPDNTEKVATVEQTSDVKEENKLNEEKLKEKQEQEAATQAINQAESNQKIEEWCARIEAITADTDEQWAYWWPKATGSHNPSTDYDAANTVSINLKQYHRSLTGENYAIPDVNSSDKEKMKEIRNLLADSIWKRAMASEKYAEAMKKVMNGKEYSLSEADGVKNRINQADQIELQAVSRLAELKQAIGK